MQTVIYQDKLYKVIHRYKSGYWEISDIKNIHNIFLVNSTELKVLSDKEKAGIK